jgi:lipopolysaccharide/colanic/teichoic acid biosynthesis glycosyltransferase
MGRPLIFRQQRIGRGERTFMIVKFRTMSGARANDGRLLPDSERLTNLGRLLRVTSLDELPQLWNIIRGDMSFIGPRPLLVSYLPYYTQRERLRHTVRPGVTGLAQINGRNELEWDVRLALDVEYVERQSLGLDLYIAIVTIVKVLRRRNVTPIAGPQWFGDLPDYRQTPRTRRAG